MANKTEQIFLVTSNRHKITEFQQLFVHLLPTYQLLTLLDFPDLETQVAETGRTYQDNAFLKANSYAGKVALPILADDSGVEVAAFPKLMGVHTHRWHPGSDHEKNLALLEKLQTVTDRRLTYHACLCLLCPHQSPHFFTGELVGEAALVPSSDHGFGYDPIMIPQGYQQTLAQMGAVVKNKISHRARALQQLATYLSTHSCN